MIARKNKLIKEDIIQFRKNTREGNVVKFYDQKKGNETRASEVTGFHQHWNYFYIAWKLMLPSENYYQHF